MFVWVDGEWNEVMMNIEVLGYDFRWDFVMGLKFFRKKRVLKKEKGEKFEKLFLGKKWGRKFKIDKFGFVGRLVDIGGVVVLFDGVVLEWIGFFFLNRMEGGVN